MRNSFVVSSVVLALLLCVSACATDPYTVTALGNEGVLIEAGGSKVMIDGLYAGLPGYPSPSSEELESRISGAGVYGGIDAVLVTHFHPDHFDADSVGRFLVANPKAVLVTSEQTREQLSQEFSGFDAVAERAGALTPGPGAWLRHRQEGVEVQVVSLHHGSDRLDIENLGFIVRLGGCTFLHVGDSLATPAELSELGLADADFDVALLPYWMLMDPTDAEATVAAIGARTVIAMHLPTADAPASYFSPAADLDELREMMRTAIPDLVLLEPGERYSVSG